MYYQRYIPHLPAAGEVVLFDRSWYNRAGVERVMGFATEKQVNSFLRYTPAIEHAIIGSGVILIKYWLEVGKEEQAKRFRERDVDLRKIWKLSPMDLEAQARWYDYSRARDAMFAATDTPESPWYVVPSDDQRRARLNCITHFLSLIPYKDVSRKPIKFPEPQKRGDYEEPDYPYRYIPAKY
jgi:polyphosphate kinase 2 (PPK2 family)